MKTHTLIGCIIVLAMTGSTCACAVSTSEAASSQSALQTAEISATQTLEVFSRTPTNTPFTPPTNTPTPVPTSTPIPTATPVMINLPAGSVTAPILLYHHVDMNGKNSRYFVDPAMFEQQMQWLYDHGYKTVTTTQLINVIKNGGQLPERPVVITFDDGDASIYKNAFPIMQKYGFVGVFYLITNYFGSSGVVTVEQVREMLNAGWEIGSHSISHQDLSLNHALINSEMNDSRSRLESLFSVTINTFAYPFGRVDEVVTSRAYKYGYLGAMGLGTSYTHSTATLFYLSREEVRFEYDMAKFISLLPWQQ